jgi:hypothetical protein
MGEFGRDASAFDAGFLGVEHFGYLTARLLILKRN